jgi:hypothetical protein
MGLRIVAAAILIALLFLGASRLLEGLRAERESTSYIGEAVRTTTGLREMKERGSELIKSREEAVSDEYE